MSKEAELFITTMMHLVHNSAARASLARANSPDKRWAAMEFVYKLPIMESDYKRDVIFTLASCFMRDDNGITNKGFGNSCKMASLRSSSDGELNESFTRHFNALLSSDERNILVNISKIISRIDSKKVAINYESLYDDLILFEKNADRVKLGWAQGYFSTISSEEK